MLIDMNLFVDFVGIWEVMDWIGSTGVGWIGFLLVV
jgi:hypothetical protein